ncbi:dTDP-4-dehydrorhamnose reductase [Maribacter sp. Asnod2-G09]|uniref:dTDP-4-dehydrorhamnose reductase n=1 Tax=Maribacter sp. Asnod2-G09 TaxID=3160577 RepID=UPI00386E1610
MINVLVTGGNGQLASSVKDCINKQVDISFIFTDVDQLDITDFKAVNTFFKNKNISYCVNCAAYTAVDNAETNNEIAEKINVLGAKNIALACKAYNAVLIHISTDFVFDGAQSNFYTEKDLVNPISVYGSTKLKGELAIAEVFKEYYIIRTSWLYSEHGNNFMKTMLRLGRERETLNVVVDQIGTPTYALDLAKVILKIIREVKTDFGIYNFSNEGVASWYDFAKAIFDESKINVRLYPIKSEAYQTPAKRPKFSVLDKTKIKETLDIDIPYWKDSLKLALNNLK